MTEKAIAWIVSWQGVMGGVIRRRVRAHTPDDAWAIVRRFKTSVALRLPERAQCSIYQDDKPHPGGRTMVAPKRSKISVIERAPERPKAKLTPPSRAARRGMPGK